jgi:hypothetical protein
MIRPARALVARALLAVGPLIIAPVSLSAQTVPPSPGPAPAAAVQAKPASDQPARPAAAQPAKPAADQAANLEPDAKALHDASSITDAEKKIEALRQVIADFPTSSVVSSGESMIVATLTRKTTDDISTLKAEATKFTAGGATTNERARRLGQTASGLAGAGVLLDDAEEYARKALGLLRDESAWIAAEKKTAAEAAADARKKDPSVKPRPEPSDPEYSSRFLSLRQNITTTLAQIEEKQGKPAEAEKFYREAYMSQPKTGGAAALKLAEFAKVAGHPFEQLEYLTVATLAGRVTAASRLELEALYQQTRGGTPADLDRMLDERYEEAVTKVHALEYTASKARTHRVVLAELFTGAGCPPCVGADLAFEAALQRYSSNDLALLVYHQHIPRPDPMTNPFTQTRKDYYNVPGTPTFFIDGGSQHVGGAAAAGAESLFEETVRSVVDKRLEVKPGADLRLKTTMAGDRIDVTARVGRIRHVGAAGQPGKGVASSRKVRLQVALVEEMVRYTGENGVRFHPMVVRSLASLGKDGLGFVVPAGKRATISHSFDLAKVAADAKAHLDDMENGSSKRFGKFQFVERKSEIGHGSSLRVVAFVQDETTKDVLQAASVVIKAPLAAGAAKAHQP